MVATNGRTVTVFGGTGFLGRRIVRICALADFPFGSPQGIQIGGTDYLVLMIRNFNPWGPIFTTNGQSRMRLPALTAL
jgi:hypothetical protein